VGFAKIKYDRKELTSYRGYWEIEPFAPSTQDARRQQGRGHPLQAGWPRVIASLPVRRGELLFEVEVEKGGRITRSYGLEDSDNRPVAEVFRVSVRAGKTTWWLSSFFNVARSLRICDLSEQQLHRSGIVPRYWWPHTASGRRYT